MGESCNETFSIFPIHTDSPFYDSNLYHSSSVGYLVIHREANTIREGEVISSPVDTEAGTLTIKWRRPVETAGFEGVSYRVLTDPARVVLVRGTQVESEGAVSHPAVPDDDSGCGNANTSCFGFLGFGEQAE